MRKFFTEGRIQPRDLQMGEEEMVFLMEFLGRKCKPMLQDFSQETPKEKLAVIFNELKEMPSKKRFEENMKFVYKIIIKKLKEKFVREKALPLWERDFE